MGKGEEKKFRISQFAPPDVQPVTRLRVATYPSGKNEYIDMYKPTKEDGSLSEFMRAGSGIDQKSGVYVIYEPRTGYRYIGSSVGTSKQANVRRTLARHWQSWDRRKALSEYVTKFRGDAPMGRAQREKGGVTFDRREVVVAVWIVPDAVIDVGGYKVKAARWIEAKMYELNLKRYGKIAGKNAMQALVRDNPDVPF